MQPFDRDPIGVRRERHRRNGHPRVLAANFSHGPMPRGADGQDRRVLGKLTPALATLRPHSRILIAGTAGASAGYFFELCEGNPRPDALVVKGSTWTWNTSLTEKDCRTLATSEAEFLREFACKFGFAESVWLPAALIDRAIDEVSVREPERGTQYGIFADPSFRNDRCAIIVAHREYRIASDGSLLDCLIVDATWSYQPTKGRSLDFGFFVDVLTTFATRYNSAAVYHDGREGNAISATLSVRGIKSYELRTTRTEQTRRALILDEMFRSNAVSLLRDRTLAEELKSVLCRQHPDGSITIEARRRNGFDDAGVDCLLLAAGELRKMEGGAQQFRPAGDVRRTLRSCRPGGIPRRAR